MQKKVYVIDYRGEKINCEITYKRMRSITFRLSRDGKTFKVSCPPSVKESYLKTKIQEVFPRLYQKSLFEKPENGDDVYIFGEFKHIDGLSSLSDEQKKELYKRLLLPYCEKRVEEYSSLMGINDKYKVKVRSMSSRYGVNNKKTHTLTFALSLIHYSPSIIDSVIVHELAHYFVFDHSNAFYKVVYTYYPSYNVSHTKLRKHIYK